MSVRGTNGTMSLSHTFVLYLNRWRSGTKVEDVEGSGWGVGVG